MIPDRFLRLLKRFLFLLIPYSLLRVGFYFYHLNIYKQFKQDEIFESFLLGIRFDVAALCLINIPIILLALIPSKKIQKFERLLFVILNASAILAALDDFELFQFMGKRLSWDLFVITDDIWEQLPQLTLYYWYFPLLALMFAVMFYFFDKKYFSIKLKKISFLKQLVGGVFVLGLSFVGIRGGLQHKSINVQTAFSQGKNELGHLVLNTPYHFLRTLKNKPLEKVKFFATDDEAKNIILNQRDFRATHFDLKSPNVVLIILESFSLEYMEQGFTPYLSELAQKGTFFKKHLANGRRSIEALPSLLCGLPSLMDEPVSKSIFQGNKFECMPKALKARGYTNYFFHGGARGTMGFESFTLANGFDRYFSREDYPEAKDFDGNWGIYDGPYLRYFADELSKMKEPFLGGVFTLSSHQPYAIPKELQGKFPKGTLEIHESIGYADAALRDFFEKAQGSSWFKNTIFIITSDHTQKLTSVKFQNMVGQYRVPLVVYSPLLEQKSVNKVTQHSDIPKTVLDLVGDKTEMPATSVGVFSGDQGVGLNYADGAVYFAMTPEKLLTLDKAGQERSYLYDWESGQMKALEGQQDPILKAYLQYFLNGLISNNLSLYR